MPGAIAGPHPGEEASVFLARSATAIGTAQVSGLISLKYAGSADLRLARPTALLIFDISVGTATATLLAVASDRGWPATPITSMVATASGTITALLTAMAYPFLAARIDGIATNTTANLAIAAPLQ